MAVLLGALVLSRAQPKTGPISVDDAAVLAADSALGEAMRSGDRRAARRLLSLQFTFVDADGKIRVRKEFLADLKGVAVAPPGAAKVRNYGLLAVVTGQRKSAHDADVLFLDVWTRQKGVWRAWLIQEVMLAADGASPAPAATAPVAVSSGDSPPPECRNPCDSIPYRVRSVPEQEIIATFQNIEKAVTAHDAAGWSSHVGDEFVRYRTGEAPVPKSERIALIERQKEAGAAVTVGEVQTMRLAVYGDAAAMLATQAVPDNSRPPYRATRIWARRNGQWQMVLSAQTDVK